MDPQTVAKRFLTIGITASLATVLGGTALSGEASAHTSPFFGAEPGTKPYDFSDDFYREHGVNPAGLTDRALDRQAPNCTLDPALVTDEVPQCIAVDEGEGASPDPSRNNIRIMAVNGGYDSGGALLYYPDPPAFMTPESFVLADNPALGLRARDIADEFNVYIFPFRDGPPFVPAPTNRRQDNIFDTSLGYLTDNPLGLWTASFVRYTDEAVSGNGLTEDQAALMIELAERNGLDEDGTPILRRVHEVKTALDAGIVISETRIKTHLGDVFDPATDHPSKNTPPWVV